MTVQEMIIQMYEQSTEALEYDPYTGGTFDIASAGAIRCLALLNRAYDYVCSYKVQSGRRLRFEELHGQVSFQTVLVEGTSLDIGHGPAAITLGDGSSQVDDYYNGYTIYLYDGTGKGQSRIVMDYAGDTLIATVNKDWDTLPDTTTSYTLCKNFYSLSDLGITEGERVFGLMKVLDMYSKEELGYGGRIDSYTGNLEDGQIPTEWVFDQNRLLFNYPVNEARWYRVEYYTLPSPLTSGEESPVIPEAFHEAMLAFCNYQIAQKMHNFEDAAYIYRGMVNLLTTLLVDDDVMQDRIDSCMYAGY